MKSMYDIAIIGAGPCGLFAVFQAGMMGFKNCAVIDSLSEVGGQCTALYPEKPIYDIPAYPKILASDLVKNLSDQCSKFSPNYYLGQDAVSLAKLDDGSFEIKTSKEKLIQCKTIVIAAGGGSFGPNRPPLNDIETYEEKSVFYYVKSAAQFEGQDIVIAGGGDSAIDWAIILSDIAKSVSIVHRREKFRANEDSLTKLDNLVQTSKVKLVVPHQLKGLIGSNGKLQSVITSDISTSKEIELKCDSLLAFFGLSMDLSHIMNWGLTVESKRIQVSHSTMQTNIPGIFAIGDVCGYPGKLNLILSGFSEAAMCMHAVRGYIHPEKHFHFEYSTSAFKGA